MQKIIRQKMFHPLRFFFITRCRGQMQSQAKEMQSKGLSKSEQRGILLQWYHTTAAAKEKAVLEYIKDLLESDKKFICFAHHQVRNLKFGPLSTLMWPASPYAWSFLNNYFDFVNTLSVHITPHINIINIFMIKITLNQTWTWTPPCYRSTLVQIHIS